MAVRTTDRGDDSPAGFRENVAAGIYFPTADPARRGRQTISKTKSYPQASRLTPYSTRSGASDATRRRTATATKAKCPAHEDKNPSLSVSQGRTRVLVKCHAGCSFQDISAALNTETPRSVVSGGKATGRGKRQATLPGGPNVLRYDYRNADGVIEFVVIRRNTPTGKRVSQWIPDGDGWRPQAAPHPRALYRLPQLLKGPRGRVLIVEGEKCADAAARAWPKQAVTTWSGGTGAWRFTDWKPLRGRNVSIVSAGNDPGRTAARAIAGRLFKMGCDVLLAQTEGDDGTDVADWLGSYPKQAVVDRIIAARRPFVPTTAAAENAALDARRTPITLAADLSGGAAALTGALRIVADDAADDAAKKAAPAAKKAAATIEVTEGTIARHFEDKYRETIRHTPGMGWFEWDADAGYWKPDRLNRAFRHCHDLAFESSPTKTAHKAATAAGAMKIARAGVLAVEAPTWNADPRLLGTHGDTVNLRTGDTFTPRPADYITKQSGAKPDTSATCPRWLRFLDESTGGAAELIAFLQRWAGYCLTGENQRARAGVRLRAGRFREIDVCECARGHPGRLRDNGEHGRTHGVQVRPASHRASGARWRAPGDGHRNRGGPRVGRSAHQDTHGRRSHLRALHAARPVHLHATIQALDRGKQSAEPPQHRYRHAAALSRRPVRAHAGASRSGPGRRAPVRVGGHPPMGYRGLSHVAT